ncbi:MAG: glycosyltransferase [Actinobacteria bacterium]|nr:glycosyltransferase [Actinomycetota bacterium]
MILETATLIACAGVSLNSCLNYFLLRRVEDLSTVCNHEIAVLLPMRNEADNIVALIASLKAQLGLAKVTFHCLDDGSTDGTFELLSVATKSDARFVIHQGLPLADGWKGKPFALQQLFNQSQSQIIVIVDADVRLTPNAISSAIATMKSLNLDFFSAYPRQIAVTWSERFIQPLLQWSWISTVPLRIAEKSCNPAFAIANGQFFLASRQALSGVDGFKHIKNEVLDDISLARLLLRSQYRGSVGDASQVASCRMYSSWNQIRQGYGKSLRVAFRSPIGFVITLTFLMLTGVLPLVLTLTGSLVGFVSLGLIFGSRAMSAASSGGNIRDALTHPISTVLLLYLIGYSLLMRRNITWKGRPV